jgi:NUDIX domain
MERRSWGDRQSYLITYLLHGGGNMQYCVWRKVSLKFPKYRISKNQLSATITLDMSLKSLVSSSTGSSYRFEGSYYAFKISDERITSYAIPHVGVTSPTQLYSSFIQRYSTTKVSNICYPGWRECLTDLLLVHGDHMFIVGPKYGDPHLDSQLLVTGGVKFGESFLHGALREVAEEIGLRPKSLEDVKFHNEKIVKRYDFFFDITFEKLITIESQSLLSPAAMTMLDNIFYLSTPHSAQIRVTITNVPIEIIDPNTNPKKQNKIVIDESINLHETPMDAALRAIFEILKMGPIAVDDLKFSGQDNERTEHRKTYFINIDDCIPVINNERLERCQDMIDKKLPKQKRGDKSSVNVVIVSPKGLHPMIDKLSQAQCLHESNSDMIRGVTLFSAKDVLKEFGSNPSFLSHYENYIDETNQSAGLMEPLMAMKISDGSKK